MIPIRVSSLSLLQVFHPCEPDYIRDVCKGACCRRSTGPVLVTLLPREEAVQRDLGHSVVDGLLAPESLRCPNQDPDSQLCGAHGTEAKPFGCIASPFMLTSRDTLVVRNRYRMLKCYRPEDGGQPAYQAHRGSLLLLFGRGQTDRLAWHLDGGGNDCYLGMDEEVYRDLKYGDRAKKEKA